VADKLAPPEKYVDPRRADPRNNVPSELRKQRNRGGGRPGANAGGGNGQGQGKPGGQNRGRNGGGQGQAQGQAKPAGGEFRGPKRANGAADQRWNPID
jgi:ATP-dependent RNA helicase RhlE